MSLFAKNPNEAAYIGGKKHWADVIKNSGDGNLLIWRQPEEDFNTHSTLIVMPGESAIFIKGGNIEAVFENGTYKLSTENYPFISRLRNAFTGGVSTFNCVVYFVRKADSQEILWGTDSPIQVRDKVWGIRTDARVRGAYKIRVSNPAVFLSKMIGNNVQMLYQSEMDKYFQNELRGKVKSAVSKFLNSLEQELIGLDAYLDQLSESVEPYLNEILEEYGLSCVKFSFSGLDIDQTKYDQLDSANIEAQNMARLAQGQAAAKVVNAQGDLGVMQTLGDNWGRQQAANILGDLARNPGAGGTGAAMGAGMGMGMAAGTVFGSMANQMFAPMNQQPQTTAAQPQEDPGNRFAPKGSGTAQYGGQQTNQPMGQPQSGYQDPVQTLSQLKQMLDNGLIPQQMYDAKVAEVLSRM